MAADDIAAVNLPPVMPTSDALPDRSRRENEKNKHKDKDKNKGQTQNQERPEIESAKPQPRPAKPRLQERKSAIADINFEPPEHELDKFA